MARVAVRAVIRGQVQRVWYRGWTEQEAQARGLDGWVRNLSDGTVEAVFAGEVSAVEDMLAACRKGPPRAEVAEVAAEPTDPPETGFRVLR
ncbi:MAG: acylphosphatase [Pseudomonadota bacterium]